MPKAGIWCTTLGCRVGFWVESSVGSAVDTSVGDLLRSWTIQIKQFQMKQLQLSESLFPKMYV